MSGLIIKPGDPDATFKLWQAELDVRQAVIDKKLSFALSDFVIKTPAASTGTFTVDQLQHAKYLRLGQNCFVFVSLKGTTSASTDRIQLDPPFPAKTAAAAGDFSIMGRGIDTSGTDVVLKGGFENTGMIFVRRGDGVNWGAGSNTWILATYIYVVQDGV